MTTKKVFIITALFLMQLTGTKAQNNNSLPNNLLRKTDCFVDGKLLFKEDFGGNNAIDLRVSLSGLQNATTDYTLSTVNQDVCYGMGSTGYWLLKNNENTKGPYNVNTQMWHTDFDDHTFPDDKNTGYMLMVDADANTNTIYENDLQNLCGNLNLFVSAQIANLGVKQTASVGLMSEPNLKFELLDQNDAVINTYITGDIEFENLGDFKWERFGFSYRLPQNVSAVKLRISNNNTSISAKNFFVMDDIEIRLCLPEVKITLADSAICSGLPFKFNALFTDDSTFGTDLIYRWEYSKTGGANTWTTLKNDNVSGSGQTTSEFVISSPNENNTGYYRVLVGNAANIDNATCRAYSDSVLINVLPRQKAIDLRINVLPSTATENRIINLTDFIDTTGVEQIKWDNYLNQTPDFTNTDEGTLNVYELSQKQRIYTYKYDMITKCGVSTAKAYVKTDSKLPKGRGKEIVVCKSHESSRRIKLNQILGLDSEGIWEYPVDPDKAIANNVDASSLFDAQKAYDDAQASVYDGNANTKVFKFRFKSTNTNLVGNNIIEFTIMVTN